MTTDKSNTASDPQPAELAEQQGVALPRLPEAFEAEFAIPGASPVSVYTAEQMQAYARAALAARQPGAPVAWLIHWSHIPLEAPEVTTSASRVDAVSALTDPPRIEPLYAASTAQGIDLGQLRALAVQWKQLEYPFSYEGNHAQRATDACCADLLALIDQSDAAPGVFHG